jgi:hypothetical protein
MKFWTVCLSSQAKTHEFPELDPASETLGNFCHDITNSVQNYSDDHNHTCIPQLDVFKHNEHSGFNVVHLDVFIGFRY